jgi:hypothetical protein
MIVVYPNKSASSTPRELVPRVDGLGLATCFIEDWRYKSLANNILDARTRVNPIGNYATREKKELAF